MNEQMMAHLYNKDGTVNSTVSMEEMAGFLHGKAHSKYDELLDKYEDNEGKYVLLHNSSATQLIMDGKLTPGPAESA